MKIRKPILVFVVISVCVMFALALFLLWDFSGPYRDSTGWDVSFSLSDPIGSLKQMFDFERRRLARYEKELYARRPQISELESSNPGDIAVLMGVVQLRDVTYMYDSNEQTLTRILSLDPAYRPAMAGLAMAYSRPASAYIHVLPDFDRLAATRPTGSLVMAMQTDYDSMGVCSSFISRGDPFVQVVNRAGTPDPNGRLLRITDAAAARKAIVQRLGIKADEAIEKLRPLAAGDPDNALYFCLEAQWDLCAERNDAAMRCIAAATGKKPQFYDSECHDCLTKAMDKAAFPDYLQQFVLDSHASARSYRLNDLTYPFKLRADAAQAHGDPNTARMLSDLAQELIDNAAPTKPAGK